MIPTDCGNIYVIEHLEQPRECLEKAVQSTWRNATDKSTWNYKKSSSNPQEGKEKINRKQNKNK